MAFTAAQRRAITTHEQNVMVVAGAGSGKTSVLVHRYLALLDAHPDWELNALVAITFTQKAAQEMRDRVRQALEQRLHDAKTPNEIALWTQRVAAMDSARIDTIHALCAAILRANAAEAGVDPGFDVLDETESYLLLSNVIDDVLRAIVAENHPSLRLFTEYGDSSAVRDMLEQFASVELPELSDDVLGTWQARRTRAALDTIAQFKASPFQTWDSRGADWLSKRWDDCNGCVERLFAAQTLDEQLEALYAIASLTMAGGKLHECWTEDGANAKADLKAIREAAKAIADTYGAALEDYDERAADLIPLWDALIRRVQDAYRDAKFAGSALDFDDLEALTCKLLSEYEDVRARYQNKEFRHVLVDEFQDTNGAQWAIVRALADPEYPGCLFIVGDARQSIYAFRGADVSVFMRVQEEFAALGSEPILLSESFRTHEPLVNCFNEMFTQILWRDESSRARDTQIELGEPMAAFRREMPCDSPPVELLLIEKSDDVDGGLDKSTQFRRSEAQQIAERIRRMVEDEQRPIYDKEKRERRAIHYGHIAILFQAMTSITLYEDALKGAGVPYVTVAGRGYYNRQEVYDLINLLQVLYNPADNLALAAVLRSPMFSLSDDALLGMRLMRDMTGARRPLWDALSDATRMQVLGVNQSEIPRIEAANLTLSELHALAGRVTIAELLRAALDKTGYLATLTGLPDGARRRGNVEKLIDKAYSSGKVTLGAFKKYIEDMSERETREGEAHLDVEGSVQLMSVHKSKGLEFPVVVLADCSYSVSSAKSGGKLLAQDANYGLVCKVFDGDQHKPVSPFAFTQAEEARKAREDAERRRLLYVAATRAQDVLILSGQVGRGSKDGKLTGRGWMDWLLDAFELRELETQPEIQQPYAWGTLRVAFGAVSVDYRRGDEKSNAWELDAVQNGEPLPGVTAHTPVLIGQPNVKRDPMARSLAASQIVDLGSLNAAQQEQQKDAARFYYQRLRRRLLHDAPHHIQPVTQSGKLSPRRLGDMVHRALQWWRFPNEADDMEALLRSYAWEQGIVRSEEADRAVKIARELLHNAMQSSVYRWLNEAKEVYRELPFVYHTEKRTIYGVIDVLFRRRDGSWGIIDYKTSFIPNVERDDDAIVSHASRFCLQMGVYAAAVREYLQEMLGEAVVPDAFIHYIRYSETVLIPRHEWEDALLRLEDHIGLLGLSHDPSTVRTTADVGTT